MVKEQANKKELPCVCFISCPQILRSDSNLKNSDAAIQQRALEYLKLSTVASPDVLVSFHAQ